MTTPDMLEPNNKMQSKLWNDVNALGGVASTPYETGFSNALDQALGLIERSGHAEMIEALTVAEWTVSTLLKLVDGATPGDIANPKPNSDLALIRAALVKAGAA